jgi:hypothetical protein
MPRRMDLEKPEEVHAYSVDQDGHGGVRPADEIAARNPFIDSVLWIICLTPKVIRDWIEELWLKISWS